MNWIAATARVFHAFLLSLWIGGAALWLSLNSVDPTLLDGRHTATGLMLVAGAQVERFGLFAGPLLLVALVIGWLPMRAPIRTRGIGAIALIAAAGINQRVLWPRLIAVREAMGRPMQELTPGDHLLARFERLELFTSGLFWFQLLIAAVLVIAAMRSLRPARSFGIEL